MFERIMKRGFFTGLLAFVLAVPSVFALQGPGDLITSVFEWFASFFDSMSALAAGNPAFIKFLFFVLLFVIFYSLSSASLSTKWSHRNVSLMSLVVSLLVALLIPVNWIEFITGGALMKVLLAVVLLLLVFWLLYKTYVGNESGIFKIFNSGWLKHLSRVMILGFSIIVMLHIDGTLSGVFPGKYEAISEYIISILYAVFIIVWAYEILRMIGLGLGVVHEGAVNAEEKALERHNKQLEMADKRADLWNKHAEKEKERAQKQAERQKNAKSFTDSDGTEYVKNTDGGFFDKMRRPYIPKSEAEQRAAKKAEKDLKKTKKDEVESEHEENKFVAELREYAKSLRNYRDLRDFISKFYNLIDEYKQGRVQVNEINNSLPNLNQWQQYLSGHLAHTQSVLDRLKKIYDKRVDNINYLDTVVGDLRQELGSENDQLQQIEQKLQNNVKQQFAKNCKPRLDELSQHLGMVYQAEANFIDLIKELISEIQNQNFDQAKDTWNTAQTVLSNLVYVEENMGSVANNLEHCLVKGLIPAYKEVLHECKRLQSEIVQQQSQPAQNSGGGNQSPQEGNGQNDQQVGELVKKLDDLKKSIDDEDKENQKLLKDEHIKNLESNPEKFSKLRKGYENTLDKQLKLLNNKIGGALKEAKSLSQQLGDLKPVFDQMNGSLTEMDNYLQIIKDDNSKIVSLVDSKDGALAKYKESFDKLKNQVENFCNDAKKQLKSN